MNVILPASSTRRLLLPLLLLGAVQALRAETLHIRMIRGSHEEGATAPALADIAAMMQNTLAFKTYALDAETHIPLPANGATRPLRVYEVTCSGPAERLNIKITRLGKRILATVATVRPGHPVVLGGFRARKGGGMRMFVLTVDSPTP
jgi:hypothetical protein